MEIPLKYIHHLNEFSDENGKIFSDFFIIKKYAKGELLLKAENYCDTVFYIEKGFCRLFQNNNDDREVNLNFYFENEFMTNMKSYLNKEKSEYSIQAYENMVVFEMKKTTLVEEYYKKSIQFQAFGVKMLQSISIRQEEHLKLFKLCTPQQRYEYIEQYQPEIIQRVPLSQIASYLGVKRETLTRIRKKKLHNKK